ncbi:MAG TPA: DHA2 family efflux MFS transporter permease subunit [Solirubrobacteraceae bacterium]|nr:DHA2 family efflux MFS transporter permease subunit [Solirubrobacteraceae bacterium]
MSDEQDRIDPYVWRIAIVVVLGSIMSILDTTIVNVALQTLHERLHSSLGDIQWVITGYLLSLATVIPLTGWASRRFGAKRVYLFSLALFTLGSALCGIANSTESLIGFRVLQGVGGGLIMPVGQLILADTAGPKRMGRVMSVTGVPTMLGPILGPTIGGLILQGVSWRWIFYVNLPIGILAIFLAMRILPASGKIAVPPRLDIRGLLLMALGMPLLTYGLAEIGILDTFTAPRVVIPFFAGAALLVLFALHAWRAKHPLLDLHLYKRGTYASASLVMFFLGAALFGAIILLPLYYQNLRHESIIDTGLLLGPQGIGMAFVMPFVGRLTDRVGGGPLALFGVVLTLLAGIPLGFIGAHTSILWLSLVTTVRGVGIGFAFMPSFVAAFASLERHELPDAAPQLNVLMRIGGSIGVAVLAVVLERALVSAGHSPSAAATAGAYGTAFWWSFGLSAAAIAPCVWLTRSERKAKRERQAAAAGEPLREVSLAEVAA